MEKDWLRTPHEVLEGRYQLAVSSVATLHPRSQNLAEIKMRRIEYSIISGSYSEVESGKMDFTAFVESKLRKSNHKNGNHSNNGNGR